MRSAGERVLRWVPSACIRRRCQYLPRYGEKVIIVARSIRWYRYRWTVRGGYRIVGWGPPGLPHDAYVEAEEPTQEEGVIKRRSPAASDQPLLPLPNESKVLHKLPLLREFLTATVYEDGSSRVPGYMTLRNRISAFEVTLYDPDAGLRCAVRANTLDDVLASAEQLLGVPEAPWEIDQYLTAQLGRQVKRKK